MSFLYTVVQAFLIFLAVALCIHLLRKTFYHFRVVHPGKLYRSGLLKNNFCRKVVCSVFGINTIVNLRSVKEREVGNWYEQETRFCRANNIEFFDIPMEIDTPPTDAQIDEFCAIVDVPGRRCLLHCEYGVIRTGMMAVAYAQKSLGLPPEEASKKHFPGFGHKMWRHDRALAFVESYRAE